ncbi:PEP-CTERM sorting domain-containing protein [Kiritimatiellaeota bacterium B1221]|nr:PEP-CTERM sorting domain-containing protein [Kiritimatiellaeota bacterium B1221]
MKKITPSIYTFPLLLSLGFSLHLPAAIQFFDDFDEATTTSPTPPTNWTSDDANPVANHGYVQSGSLNYPGLQPSTGNRFGLGDKTADYTASIPTTVLSAGEAIYLSFLIQINSPLDPFNYGNLSLFNSSSPSGGTLRLGWGTSDHNTNKMGFSISDRNANFSGSEGADLAKTSESYDIADTTYLIVAGYNRGVDAASSSVSLWVNPTNLGDNTAPAATVTLSDIVSWSHGAMDTWDSLRYASNGSGSAPSSGFSLDEIRVGTTWADVTPIPEPSTLFLSLGALLSIVLLHKRK